MPTIIGIKLPNRLENAALLQTILTNYGCSIRTRIGLHNLDYSTCYPDGIILIDVIDNPTAVKLEVELSEIDDIELQKMVF